MQRFSAIVFCLSMSLLAGPARAQEIGTLDYSDTFTFEEFGGVAGRANGVSGAANIAAYAVEDTHGNPPSTWFPQTNFSFNDVAGSFGDGPVVLAAATGNPGAATGLAQSGGNDFSFAYGLRTNYIVKMDAFLSPGDRTDISSLPNAGDTIFAANSLSVFFRRTSQGNMMVGVYNGSAETTLGSSGLDDDNWHKLGVHFNQDDDLLGIYIDEALFVELDLATFQGGAYQNYSNGAVGAGGAGAFVRNLVNWFDNFEVGAPPTPPVFCDLFDRADGPLDGWTVNAGTWNIESESLIAGPSAGGGQPGEQQAFAGDPLVPLPPVYTIEFDWEFLAPTPETAPVGRHAGCFFEFNQPGIRWDAATSGYQLWWIDRASDFGLTLARWTGAGFVALNPPGGTGALFAAPPSTIRIEVEGSQIRVYGDDVLAIDVADNTYRGGIFGFWTWDGSGQTVRFDNVKITQPAVVVAPCIESSPATIFAGEAAMFDGTCSIASEEIVSYEWDLGDGTTDTGQSVEHAYAAPDVYTVVLTITAASGASASAEQTITVHDKALALKDDFERADGPVDGWTVGQGATWSLAGGTLAAGPTTTEHFIWAGSPAIAAPGIATFDFDYSFLAPGTVPAVGRHGGFQFHCSSPTQRSGGGAFSGYFIDWIDRASDRGIRLTRVASGAQTVLVNGQGAAATPEPPAHWRVETDATRIRVYGDDVLLIDLEDATYRSGFFGFWTWEGGQEVAIDNLCLDGQNLTPCFSTSDCPIAAVPTTLDAGCSSVFVGDEEIVSWEWDFGDGTQGSGETVEHTYSTADVYTVTLVVTTDLGTTAEASGTVTVSEPLLPFRACFEDGAGPPADWTVASGVWNVTADGVLSTDTIANAGEAFIYAGSPPRILGPEFVAEVDLDFIEGTVAGVGRHGAVHFYWNGPTTNRFAADSSGYVVFYIDRASDRGLTLARFDGAALAVLNPPGGTPAVPDPPRRLRIEVDGPTIRVYADGVLAIEADDDTYRCGLFGVWAYLQNRIEFDNVRIWDPASDAPELCDPTPGLAGDCNVDGTRNITDVICYISRLFPGFFLIGGVPSMPLCEWPVGDLALLDINGDGVIDISEPVYLARYLFMGGPPPVQGEACVITTGYGCMANAGCQ